MSFIRIALALGLGLCVFACDARDSPYPARVQLDGSPDSCELLFAAEPQKLFAPHGLAPYERYYGLCLAQAADWTTRGVEQSVAFEIRTDAAFVARSLDEFWEREGGGVGMAGGKREEIAVIPALGDFALWHPVEGGLRLFTYWKGKYVLVLTVKGVPREQAFPWAESLARAAVQKGSS